MAQGKKGLSAKKSTNTRHHERRASKTTVKKGGMLYVSNQILWMLIRGAWSLGMVIKSKKQSIQRHLKTKIV
jgi:hypothetical protein